MYNIHRFFDVFLALQFMSAAAMLDLGVLGFDPVLVGYDKPRPGTIRRLYPVVVPLSPITRRLHNYFDKTSNRFSCAIP